MSNLGWRGVGRSCVGGCGEPVVGAVTDAADGGRATPLMRDVR